MNPFKGKAGLTLLEVVLAVGLLGVLAAVSVQMVGGNQDAERYEQTRVKMEAIRVAIFGDDALDSKGERLHYGYYGDMGGFPVTLSSLLTRGSQPAWAFDTGPGIGAGWRGPYYRDPFTTSLAVDLDAWGTSFVYATTGTPSLTSRGSDKAAGTTAGSVYSKDLVMNFDSSLRFSSVRGFVRDGDSRIANAKVELRYPSAGVLTTVSTTSAADGSFTFNTVPPSFAAVTVSSVPITGLVPIGPRRVAVAGLQYFVPNFLMNYFSSKQKITLNGTPVAVAGSVTMVWTSSYEIPLSVDYITVNWTGAGFISTLQVGAAGATNVSGGVNCPGSGVTSNQIAAGQIIAANTLSTTVVLGIANVSGACSGNTTDLTGVPMYIQIRWKESTETDVISFSPS